MWIRPLRNAASTRAWLPGRFIVSLSMRRTVKLGKRSSISVCSFSVPRPW
jgi:hypothetical protein